MTEALVFRCDENAETGLGHFARCRDLARLLRLRMPGLPVKFAGELSPYARGVLAELGFEHWAMERGEALISERLRRASGREQRLLVDSYRLDAETLEQLGQWPAPWGVFDDFGAHDYANARLVINARVSADAGRYAAACVAAGPAYFPATPELVDARAHAGRRDVTAAGPERALAFVGGSDFSEVGPRLASALTAAFPAVQVLLVQARPLSQRLDRVEAAALGPGLEAELARAALVVAGGGRLKYEACYCQLPCASVSQTEGQAQDTAELAERGLCLDLGLAADFEHEQAVAALRGLWCVETLTAMREAQARAFPLDAPERLARAVTAALALA